MAENPLAGRKDVYLYIVMLIDGSRKQETPVSKIYHLICLWLVISCIGSVEPVSREHQRLWVYELLNILISIRDMVYSLEYQTGSQHSTVGTHCECKSLTIISATVMESHNGNLKSARIQNCKGFWIKKISCSLQQETCQSIFMVIQLL